MEFVRHGENGKQGNAALLTESGKSSKHFIENKIYIVKSSCIFHIQSHFKYGICTCT